jgi:hypothetical protein
MGSLMTTTDAQYYPQYYPNNNNREVKTNSKGYSAINDDSDIERGTVASNGRGRASSSYNGDIARCRYVIERAGMAIRRCMQ